jgi:hypothetical protein
MSLMSYPVVKSATPVLCLDDGYASVQSGTLEVVCGLTQVYSIVQSGTGVITVNLSRSLNIISVRANAITGSASSNIAVNVVSVSNLGTNASGNPSIQIILQAVTRSSGSAVSLSSGQGLCLEIRYSESNNIVGSAQQAGMAVL